LHGKANSSSFGHFFRPMRLFVLLFLASCVLAAAPLRAATNDPGDLFVTAYMAVQQAEKAEHGGNLKLALTKYRYAAGVLDQISSASPKWSPEIVSYRKSRTSEAVARVQEKIARGGSGKTDRGEGPLGLPLLPQTAESDKPLIFETPGELAPPSPDPVLTPRNTPRRSTDASSDRDPLQEAALRMKNLEQDLKNAKEEAERLQSEKADLARKLDEASKARVASEARQTLLQKRSDNAEQALMKAMSDGKTEADKIKTLQADYEKARREMRTWKIESEADAEYRQQLDDRYKVALNKIAVLTQERDAATAATTDAPGKIAQIQKDLDRTKKERDELAAKLQKTEGQLVVVQQQRDEALTQVAKLKEAQKQVDKLVADNATLMAKLADAEKSITQFKAEGAQKDQEIAALKKEVGSVKEQLAQAKQESADYQRQMADMQVKLEESGKLLAQAKADNAASVAEKKKMQEENTILRGIVLRQQKEEAVRAKTRKMLLAEMADLEINSKTLLKQIDLLSQPIVKLTEKERALFKSPELQVSDTEISIGIPKEEEPQPAASVPEAPMPAPSALPAIAPAPKPAATPAPAPSVVTIPAPAATPVPVPSTPMPAPVVEAVKPAKPAEPLLPSSETQPALSLSAPPKETDMLALNKPPAVAPAPPATPPTAPETLPSSPPDSLPGAPGEKMTPSGAGEGVTSASPNVPAELMPLAREGKEQFERGNYLDAEKTYRKILAKAPNNLYTLSNLGVVLFRGGKYKLAEDAFKKAIAIAPEDGFSHCTLGIVFYSQAKYDEAVNELTKALALNPKNATAHNYLGITASQKGWQEAAQKELETAVQLDPNYADAHFNLAVVYAMQTPPNKEKAREHYKKAIELGAEPDTALEQLIKAP
jgi:Flp pilus assembly protein TadD